MSTLIDDKLRFGDNSRDVRRMFGMNNGTSTLCRDTVKPVLKFDCVAQRGKNN